MLLKYFKKACNIVYFGMPMFHYTVRQDRSMINISSRTKPSISCMYIHMYYVSVRLRFVDENASSHNTKYIDHKVDSTTLSEIITF